jgi:tripartite-type tricarboxylate transporter receptor subunit TctC
LASSPDVFLVKPDLPAKTMKDFIALARANPDKYNVSVPPIGTAPQLMIALLKIRENLPTLAEVVFKGGGDAVEALLAGTVQICAAALAPAVPHIKSGTMRGLAISSDSHWPDLQDIPTMAESGYDNFVFATDCALLAPVKTSAAQVKWLETETLKVLSTPEMKDKLFQAGFLVRPKGADAAWARIAHEMDMYKQIIEQAGVKKI